MGKTNNNQYLDIRKFVAPEYVFGADSRFMAVQYCRKLGARKCFVATDKNIMQTQWFSELKNALENANFDYYIFSDISPNPRTHEVMAGSKEYLESGCNIILALGGGSVIDCAKGIGIVSSCGDDIRIFEGVDKIHKPMPPLISIPTTGGTSADVSQFAIINNADKKYKFAIISKALISDVALVDPVCLTSMSSDLTINTGMDALSHAFEAYVSNAASPVTDLYALKAIELIIDALPACLKTPDNIELRGKMMLGSLYAGLAFSNASLGCVHSLAHSLGGFLDLPHGECNAILLPHVVDFNYASAISKYKEIAHCMRINISGQSDLDVKKSLIASLKNFKSKFGLVENLREKGVSSDIIPLLAKKAIIDPCNATNPYPPNIRDLELMYEVAM